MMNLNAGTDNQDFTRYASSAERSGDQWTGDYYSLLLKIIRIKFNRESALTELKAGLEHINWDKLVLFAELYGIKPVIFDYLRHNFTDLLPADLKQDIDTYFRIASPHAFFQVRELAKVSEILAQHGISNTTFKGPVLAVLAHGDITLRRSVDMDLLISAENLQTAEQVLTANGYEAFHKIQRLSSTGKKSFLWLSQQYPFKKAGGIFNLDLHTSIMPPGYRYSKPYELYQKHSKRYKISEFTVMGLSAEDLLIVLCYHGAKNRWESLKYVLDITALIHSNPEINWDIVEETITQYGDRRILSIGLSLANRLFHTALTEEITAIIRSDKQAEFLTLKLLNFLESKQRNSRMSYYHRVQFHFMVQKSVRAKMGYIAHSVFRHLWTMIYN